MPDKKYELAKAITKFKKSEQTKSDYMKLFMGVNISLKQGSGLVWSEVDEILEKVLNKS